MCMLLHFAHMWECNTCSVNCELGLQHVTASEIQGGNETDSVTNT